MNNDEVIDMFFPIMQANLLLPEIKLHTAVDIAPILALAEAGIIDAQ